MRDILTEVTGWLEAGQAVALATVVESWGSSPRAAGAKMAVTAAGGMAGSVSGGCVEGAVFECAQAVLQDGQPRLLHFGVADETAWEVGLACGGQIDVFVARLVPAEFAAVRRELESGQPFALATLVAGPAGVPGQTLLLTPSGVACHNLPESMAGAVEAAAREALRAGQSGRRELTAAGQRLEVFVEVELPAPVLIMVGGVHISIALAALAKVLGYRTVVVDPRRAFGSQARFPHVDQLIQAWPDQALQQVGLTNRTAVAMLTHDPKLDDPALLLALPSPAFYVGALGSRATQARRRERLLKAGLTPAQLDRLRGPIGLDLGGRTPEEIALAVLAEVTRVRHGRGAEAAVSPGARPSL